jgi:hypothetical protein
MRLWVVLAVWPFSYALTRLASVVLLAGLWVGVLGWSAGPRWVRVGLWVLTVALAGFLIAPGREASAERLRDRYVLELRRLEGVRYVWGGENGWGIDCSGLVRRALVRTLWAEAWRTLNPALARDAIGIWWRDTSARAMGEGHAGWTRWVQDFPRLAEGDDALVAAGDLAVTSNGVHVMAALGNGEWMEADPAYGRVVMLRARGPGQSDSPWLRQPVRLMRWRWLESAGPEGPQGRAAERP